MGDAKTVHVRLNGESEPREAAVVISDPSRDLALLRVTATGLAPATFAAPGSRFDAECFSNEGPQIAKG